MTPRRPALKTSIPAAASEADPGIRIVATIFPEYDWVKTILGENPANAEISFLYDSGVDLHNYQPTADDVLEVGSCDLIVYVGGESDEQLEKILEETADDSRVEVNLLSVLGSQAKTEELVEGMEEHDHEEDHDHGEEYDEHVWLSLKNASLFAEAIADALAEVDPANADLYAQNAAAYQEKLKACDEAYQKAVEAAPVHTLLFGDRFPFRYLTDDYGLSYYAAFVGCSAETEASFDTITFLAKKVDELGLTAVLTIDSADQRIAETIVSSTQTKDQQILSMNSMQSTTMKDVSNGVTYLSLMESNLEVLKQALQ